MPVLAERFLTRFASEMGKDVAGFTPDALRAIERHTYPGTVRELENVIERAVALAGARVIGTGDLPEEVSGQLGAPEQTLLTLGPDGCDLDAVLNEAERRLLIAALERSGGSSERRQRRRSALHFASLRYRLRKHGLGGDGASDEPSDDGPESSEDTE